MRKKILKNKNYKIKRKRRNPLSSISVTEFFNIKTPDNFNAPGATKVDYFQLGVNLGLNKSLRFFRGEDQQENDIKYFFDQYSKSFSGLVNKTPEEAFEYGIVVGLNAGIYYADTDINYVISKTNREIELLTNRFNIKLIFKNIKRPVTFY